jgi:hypothetical protein
MELHIRDVPKTYSNGVQALKDVTLTIPVGSTACSALTVPANASLLAPYGP